MTAARESALIEALKDVEDPEFPISVVDMGLVVDLSVDGGHVTVKLTFTAMGCPAMDMIIDDVRARLLAEADVDSVHVEIVWDPVWTSARLSEDGKFQLREWGISV